MNRRGPEITYGGGWHLPPIYWFQAKRSLQADIDAPDDREEAEEIRELRRILEEIVEPPLCFEIVTT